MFLLYAVCPCIRDITHINTYITHQSVILQCRQKARIHGHTRDQWAAMPFHIFAQP
jgi:hypothetical protein